MTPHRGERRFVLEDNDEADWTTSARITVDSPPTELGIAYSDEAAYYRIESFLSHTKRIATLPKLRVAIEIGKPLQFEDRTPLEMKDLAQEQVQMLVNRARARLES